MVVTQPNFCNLEAFVTKIAGVNEIIMLISTCIHLPTPQYVKISLQIVADRNKSSLSEPAIIRVKLIPNSLK